MILIVLFIITEKNMKRSQMLCKFAFLTDDVFQNQVFHQVSQIQSPILCFYMPFSCWQLVLMQKLKHLYLLILNRSRNGRLMLYCLCFVHILLFSGFVLHEELCHLPLSMN
jgi:hypothetical protein